MIRPAPRSWASQSWLPTSSRPSPDGTGPLRQIVDVFQPSVGAGRAGRLPPDRLNDRQQFVETTADLRDTVSLGRAIQLELGRTDPADPNREHLLAQLEAIDEKLTSRYGYTTSSAPRPGQLFIDPQFLGSTIPDGLVTRGQYPMGDPVTAPPSAIDALFGGGRPVQSFGPDGTVITFATPDEYRAFVAENRVRSEMARSDGEPVAAQWVLQGGGGKGKRFASVAAELINQGVIPASVSGTSAGALAASFLAAGADPVTIDHLVKDPMLSKLLELGLNGGLDDGKALYDHVDRVLRQLTGITDRPVTFADLRMPLQILATRMYDSTETDRMTTVESRKFVFSQETTPDTPVALAVRASVAIPGAFDPVQMVDPMTGREVMLVDGGVLDNLPMGLAHNGLPVIGISLQDPNENHPLDPDNLKTPRPLQAGNIDVSTVLANAGAGKRMHEAAGGSGDDFRNRSQPRPGEFMFGIPCWNLDDPTKADTVMKFQYDPEIDPALDAQSTLLTRDFLRRYLDDLGIEGRSGTNAFTELPAPVRFRRALTVGGRPFTATYTGGDDVLFEPQGEGEAFTATIGKMRIEAMWLDHRAYGDLSGKLRQAAKVSA